MNMTPKSVDFTRTIVFKEFSSVSQMHIKVMFTLIGVALNGAVTSKQNPTIQGKSTAEKTAIVDCSYVL